MKNELTVVMLIGLVVTISLGSLIFFQNSGTIVNGDKTTYITPLGFDIVVLLIILVSGIILVLSNREKKKNG